VTRHPRIDPEIAAVQLARIAILLAAGTITAREADDARVRAGQVLVLREDGHVHVYVYAIDAAEQWTHVLTTPGEPAGMAAALDVDDHMLVAVHERYNVGNDALGRVIAVPRGVQR
jgi:hypothetical protein